MALIGVRKRDKQRAWSLRAKYYDQSFHSPRFRVAGSLAVIGMQSWLSLTFDAPISAVPPMKPALIGGNSACCPCVLHKECGQISDDRIKGPRLV